MKFPTLFKEQRHFRYINVLFFLISAESRPLLCQSFAYIAKVKILDPAENPIFGRISTLQT